MARFDRQIETALRLIKKNGEGVVYNVIRDGDPADPDQPWKPGDAVVTPNPAVVCFLPINFRSDRVLAVMAKNPDVQLCNEMGLMGAVSWEPDGKDTITRDGKEYRIVDFDVLRPNGQNILYTFYFMA